MNNHPLQQLIKTGNFSKIDSYFQSKNTLTAEETDLLLSGLKSKEWRIRHRCAKALRLGTLHLEACELLKRTLNDKEDLVVVAAFLSLLHQPLMQDFVCTFLTKEKTSILYNRYPTALFLEDLYKTAFEISFVDSRFSDFTDKVLLAGMKKNTTILDCNIVAAIKYAAVIGHNRQSTIDILLQINKSSIENNGAQFPSRWREYSVNSLCALQLPTQEYKDQVYELARSYGFWITLPKMLHFAKQFSFDETQKKDFILSILRRYGDVTEEDYTALLELRKILQIDSTILMQDEDIRTEQSDSKSTFQALIHGTTPFNYMPLQRTPIFDGEIFEVMVNAKRRMRFLLDANRSQETEFAALTKVNQADLNNLTRASDFTITEEDDNNQQYARVLIKYGYQTDFRYSADSIDSSFYHGDDRGSWSELNYELYIELAQRAMYSKAFANGADHLLLQLLEGISTGDIEEIETTLFWIEHNISPYYFTQKMLSSCALTLLDIHFPQEQRRSSIKGNAVEFIRAHAQTQRDTLLYILLAAFAIHHDNCPDIGSELEVFFEDLFQPELSDDAHRAFVTVIHGLKTEAKGEYIFWLNWFRKRCQNTALQKFLRKKQR